MKKSLISVLMVGVLGIALLAVACTPGETKTKTTDDGGGTGDVYPKMKDVGGPAVDHSAADITALTCLEKCHNGYSSKYDQKHVPTPGTWWSFAQEKFFTVDAGSKADHTSVTNSQCFDANCHTKP